MFLLCKNRGGTSWRGRWIGRKRKLFYEKDHRNDNTTRHHAFALFFVLFLKQPSLLDPRYDIIQNIQVFTIQPGRSESIDRNRMFSLSSHSDHAPPVPCAAKCFLEQAATPSSSLSSSACSTSQLTQPFLLRFFFVFFSRSSFFVTFSLFER